MRTRNGEEGEADAEAIAKPTTHRDGERRGSHGERYERSWWFGGRARCRSLTWNPLKSMNGQAATEMAREAYKHLTEEAAKLYMRKIFFAGAVGRAGSMIVFQMPVSEEWTGYKPGASS